MVCLLNTTAGNNIIIRGTIKHFPAKKIYIVDAHNWTILLDSADVKDGEFQINLSMDRYEPFLASLVFKSKEGKLQFLSYQISDKVANGNNGVTETNSFMVDLKTNYIEGEVLNISHNQTNPMKIASSEENDTYFKFCTTQFSIAGDNEAMRKKQIEFIEGIISQNKNSYYLLSTLNNYKRFWKSEELIKTMNLFSPKLLASQIANELSAYIKSLSCKNCALPPVELISVANKKVNLSYTEGKTNLIIFWASWCVPCRREIPLLRSIYSRFKNRGLIIKSISIDDNPAMWHKALLEEKMEWAQYLIPENTISQFQTNFNFLSIPLILLVDTQGHELKRIVGQNDTNSQLLDSYLNMVLPR